MTVTDIEEEIIKLQSQRDVFMLNKKQFEAELSNLNARVRSRTVPISENEYDSICRRQRTIKNSLNEIQPILTEYKKKIGEKVILKERLKNSLSSDSDTTLIDRIIILKDKYADFASDSTRVSSMRTMASQLSQELESIIKRK